MIRTLEFLVYEPDLMFASNIESAASKAGATVRFVQSLQQLSAQLSQVTPRVLILNLDAAEAKLSELEALIRGGSVRSVGYYSHVNAKLAEEARRIGIETVLARGAFSARLGQILKELG